MTWRSFPLKLVGMDKLLIVTQCCWLTSDIYHLAPYHSFTRRRCYDAIIRPGVSFNAPYFCHMMGLGFHWFLIKESPSWVNLPTLLRERSSHCERMVLRVHPHVWSSHTVRVGKGLGWDVIPPSFAGSSLKSSFRFVVAFFISFHATYSRMDILKFVLKSCSWPCWHSWVLLE